jgi:hypothetical protein
MRVRNELDTPRKFAIRGKAEMLATRLHCSLYCRKDGGTSISDAIPITIKCIRVMSRHADCEKLIYRGIPAGSPVDGVRRGTASWRNVSTVMMATSKNRGKPPNAPNAG